MDDQITKLSQVALERYFKVLSQFGYKSYSEIKKLLTLLFIQNFLQLYWQYITEEDYDQINKVLEYLYGSTCLIPYQYYKTYQASKNTNSGNNIKVTEDMLSRSTEEQSVRIIQ